VPGLPARGVGPAEGHPYDPPVPDVTFGMRCSVAGSKDAVTRPDWPAFHAARGIRMNVKLDFGNI
jgi:hypothetical protein